ncbi:Retrovirus-related Pol polyprotein from transposon 297,Retrovirus-related Pol polyprotein from transposon 17.6 [Mytilus coruscus]|uniref:Retrovirus-related Pol polyprotein from transposon 297,Retrovirus-related Pol polyprotein from transposon 17.6 n=1 Tax=Mytilus coruscus TaxID=42192 RepID=A0A6J8A1J8_MYTCO|nr:Retrovirus-related Pol polyprotein from transposon 297,Retrovirus-related Pol polyprotein from transposon 17.6 [Mytilus coruscus]
METGLLGLQWNICLIYLDDIIVLGRSFDDMVTNHRKIFDQLYAAGLKLKATKCELFSKQVIYLGHVISLAGIATDPEKTEIIETWPVPKHVKELRSFLGFCGYYRKFIQRFSGFAKPLHRLTEKDRKYEWNEQFQEAFECLKSRIASSPVLAHPDFTQAFILDTDACNEVIGAVPSHEIDGKEKKTIESPFNKTITQILCDPKGITRSSSF